MTDKTSPATIASRWEEVVGTRTEAPELVALARIRPGDTVIDVASATSETAVVAAQQVGPQGRVLVVDVTPGDGPADVGVGQRVTQMGLGNVEFARSPVPLDLPATGFTAAISSLGLLLVPDPRVFLESLRAHLRPSGRVALSVWSTPHHVPIVDVALEAFGPAAIPDDLFEFCDQRVLAEAVEHAGFTDVGVVTTTITAEFASASAYADFALEGVEPVAELARRSPEEAREALHAAIRDAAAERCTTEGVVQFENEMLLAVGTAG